MEIKVINKSENKLPKYETELSAGLDIRANLPDGSIKLMPLGRTMIPTGLFIESPKGYEVQIRPRSGMAYKYGITVINTPGTIDADYRGEIKVLLVNISNEMFVINNGDRIAQMVVNKHEVCEFKEVDELSVTDRGEGGFSSTGEK